jgi:D-cysteine desulfhydrase family pyridoxal phosphate-dependent enzyme
MPLGPTGLTAAVDGGLPSLVVVGDDRGARSYGPAVLDRRVPLSSVLPTPLEPMDRLGAALGLPPGSLWVKRDDLTGLGGGGNKVRKLEYLAADAIAQGCDVLVTGGGRQSNHVRLTAATANRLGLGCTVVLSGGEPEVPTGNVVLDLVLGADIVWAPDAVDYYSTEAAIGDACDRLVVDGRRPYRMPIGGASAVGALGYVACALELDAQLAGAAPAVVVVADGSGGTHAGLAAGLGSHDRVLGVDVGTRPDLDDRVPEKAAEVAALAGLPAPRGALQLDHGRFGDGYGAPTDDCLDAVRLAARTEGLLLDPVYTGKAMAGLIAAVRDGRVSPPIVFVHTGGLPAFFTNRYAQWVKG